MTVFANSIIDWGALWQVVYISAIAGVAIASILGLAVVSSLRAEDRHGLAALALNAVTIACVVAVGAAVIVGIYFIANKG